MGSVFYNNPVNFIFYLLMGVSLYVGKIVFPPLYKIFLWLSLPLILVILVMSFFNETLPHWSGPAYTSLLLPAGVYLDKITRPGLSPSLLKVSGTVFLFVVMIGILAINFMPVSIGSADEKNLGKGDITLDMTGWEGFSRRFDSLYLADMRSGAIKPGATILSDYWFPAAHLDHYLAQPYNLNILAIGPLQDIHHYAWMNGYRKQIKSGEDAYFIYPSNYYGPPKSSLKNCFERAEDSIVFTQYRSGRPVRNFVIYRLHGAKPACLQQLFFYLGISRR